MSREAHVRFCEGVGVKFPCATHLIIGCELEDDAKRIMAVLPKRFSLFKLTIHPTKTKLIRFRRPPSKEVNGTFDFLGFTHFWAKTQQGYWVIKRKTAKKRLSRTMKSLWQWCREHRHDNISEQYKALCLKLRGHYQYYGIRSNFKMLEVVMEYTEKAWRHWLGRRSRESYISWELFDRIRHTFPLPKPRICHAI